MSIPAQGAVGAETMTAGPKMVLLPMDDPSQPLHHSGLPSAMIRAGGDAFHRLKRDHSLVADSCSLAVGIYRAMTEAHAKEIATLTPPAALASPRADSDERTAGETLKEACKPWEHYTGEPPDDGSPLSGVFVAGMVYTERLLAKLLDVTHYEGGDGSEDFDSDATQTLRNILTGARLWDADENRPISASPAQPAGAVPDSLRALSEALAPCSKAEIEAWETYAKGRGHDMHEHPLHYLFMDEKTSAARYGWKAGIAWALSFFASNPAGQSAGSGDWSEHSPQEIVRRTRCMADETRDATVWRDCCDLILERLGKPAPDSTRTDQGEASDGWVLVPERMDPIMIGAFWRWKNTGSDVPGEFGDDRSDAAAYRAMIAARPAAPEAQGVWRPISTAPKDGSEILLTDGSTVCAGFWDDAVGCRRADAGWFEECDRAALINAKNLAATHWQSMPAPPASSGQGGR